MSWKRPWLTHQELKEIAMLSAIEVVALGFRPHEAYEGRWIQLFNSAEGDRSKQFAVHDADVRYALLLAQELELGEKICMWHSHRGSIEPSQYDLEHLPEWCEMGIVYHVPSDTLVAYRHASAYQHAPATVIPNKAQ